MLKKAKRSKLGKQIYRRLMKRVLERDEWRCQKCGLLENLQVHHPVKRSQGGLAYGKAWHHRSYRQRHEPGTIE
jgi:5-methylcytosine-specific restriction endonuclease McrA